MSIHEHVDQLLCNNNFTHSADINALSCLLSTIGYQRVCGNVNEQVITFLIDNPGIIEDIICTISNVDVASDWGRGVIEANNKFGERGHG